MSLLIRQAQSQSDASGTATFQFNAVEPGYTWTFSILPVVPTIPGYNFGNATPLRGQQVFGNAVWTFFRNGIPEFTWTGYTIPKNIQARGTENVAVQGTGLAPNSQCTVTLRGSSDPQDMTSGDAVVPEFDHVATPGGGPDSASIIPSVAQAINGGTATAIVAATGVQISLWSVGLTISQTNPSAGANLQRTVALLQTTSGLTVARVAVSTYAVGDSANNQISLNYYGLLLPIGDGLNLVSSNNSPAADNVCESTVMFTQA
jgi:hypothetical protein